MIDSYLADRLGTIRYVCLEYNVSKLYAFGSIVDGRFKVGISDIDFLIEFDEKVLSKREISKNLFIIWIKFQEVLNSEVDLIFNKKVKGKYFKKYLELYKVLVYDNQLNVLKIN